MIYNYQINFIFLSSKMKNKISNRKLILIKINNKKLNKNIISKKHEKIKFLKKAKINFYV